MGVVCGFLGGDWFGIGRGSWLSQVRCGSWVVGLELVWIVVDRWVLNQLHWLGFESVWIVAGRGGFEAKDCGGSVGLAWVIWVVFLLLFFYFFIFLFCDQC